MSSTLQDLNNHLFEQMKRLNNPDIIGTVLDEEIKRSSAVTSLAAQIINNANVVLKAQMFKDNALDANMRLPQMLEGNKDG